MDGNAYPITCETDDNGKRIIRFTSADYTEAPYVPIQVASIVMYAIFAVVSVILLIIKLIRRLMKKNSSYSGAAMIIAGQLAKIVSVIMIPVLLFRLTAGWGLDKTDGVIIGCVQAVCMIICAMAALSSAVMLFSKQEKKAKNAKYILNMLANAFAVCFAVYFDLFQFWGC